MISQRDQQLCQLGITQWVLRRPTVLQGKINISLPTHIRLVMVADDLPSLNEIIISDVLHTLNISARQVLQLTSDRIIMLLPNSHCNSWYLGSNKRIFTLKGNQLISPAYKELQINPEAKNSLWQQIYKHEHIFLPYKVY